jgi:hypothetical protein
MPSALVGSATTSNLTGLTFIRGDTPGNMRFITSRIRDDRISGFPLFPGAFSNTGILTIPNRGVLQVFPGDVIATDSVTGWPVLISAAAVAGGQWIVA